MKKMIVTAAAVCMLLSACEKTDYDKSGKAERNEQSPAESESDRAISQHVRTALKNDATISSQADTIKIMTTSAVVTLRGTVKSESDKSAAGKKARLVPGVRAVDNQLEIAH